MKVQLFSVLDLKANQFLAVNAAQTIEVAIRTFKHTCDKADHEFALFPEDYVMYHVGEFEADDGTLVPMSPPRPIAKAIDFRKGANLQSM